MTGWRCEVEQLRRVADQQHRQIVESGRCDPVATDLALALELLARCATTALETKPGAGCHQGDLAVVAVAEALSGTDGQGTRQRQWAVYDHPDRLDHLVPQLAGAAEDVAVGLLGPLAPAGGGVAARWVTHSPWQPVAQPVTISEDGRS